MQVDTSKVGQDVLILYILYAHDKDMDYELAATAPPAAPAATALLLSSASFEKWYTMTSTISSLLSVSGVAVTAKKPSTYQIVQDLGVADLQVSSVCLTTEYTVRPVMPATRLNGIGNIELDEGVLGQGVVKAEALI